MFCCVYKWFLLVYFQSVQYIISLYLCSIILFVKCSCAGGVRSITIMHLQGTHYIEFRCWCKRAYAVVQHSMYVCEACIRMYVHVCIPYKLTEPLSVSIPSSLVAA